MVAFCVITKKVQERISHTCKHYRHLSQLGTSLSLCAMKLASFFPDREVNGKTFERHFTEDDIRKLQKNMDLRGEYKGLRDVKGTRVAVETRNSKRSGNIGDILYSKQKHYEGSDEGKPSRFLDGVRFLGDFGRARAEESETRRHPQRSENGQF